MISQTPSRPIALTIAGSDSSGGAGIQADLKSFSAFGVYGASVITALTAQNTTGVQDIHLVPAAFVGQQLQSVQSDLTINAIKTGMLANAEIINCICTALTHIPPGLKPAPLVVDPVMVATSGDRLLARQAETAMKQQLLPLASLITPNLDEAAALLDTDRAKNRTDMVAQGQALQEMGPAAVLVKGGHLADHRDINDQDPKTDAPSTEKQQMADDVLICGDRIRWFSAPWIATEHTHGTGCTLAAAITACLALGDDTATAIARAKAYLTSALEAGTQLSVGQGHGPVDHLVDIDEDADIPQVRDHY